MHDIQSTRIGLLYTRLAHQTTTMPRFLCYCPDHPDQLDKRMAVRPEHLERVTKEKQDGTQGE